MRTNIESWKILQDNDYFEQHPVYKGLRDFDSSTTTVIEKFVELNRDMDVALIGCAMAAKPPISLHSCVPCTA